MTQVRGGTGSDGDGKRRRREEQQEPTPEVIGEINTASVALKAERYRPRIFGFQVHEIAKLHRWQEAVRDRCATTQSAPLIAH